MPGNPSPSPSQAPNYPSYPMYPYPPYPYAQPTTQAQNADPSNVNTSASVASSDNGAATTQSQVPPQPANPYYPPPPFGMYPPYGYGFPGQPPQPGSDASNNPTKQQQAPPGYPPNYPMPPYPFPYPPYMGMPVQAVPPGTPGQSSASGSQPPQTPNAAQSQPFPQTQLQGGAAPPGMNWPYPAYPPPYWGWPYAPPPTAPASTPAVEAQPTAAPAPKPQSQSQADTIQVAATPKKKVVSAVQLASLAKARQVRQQNYLAGLAAKAKEKEEAAAGRGKNGGETSTRQEKTGLAGRGAGGDLKGKAEQDKGKKRKSVAQSPVPSADVPEPVASKKRKKWKGWAVLSDDEAARPIDMEVDDDESVRGTAVPAPTPPSQQSTRLSSRLSQSDADESGEGSSVNRMRWPRKPRAFYGNYIAADIGAEGKREGEVESGGASQRVKPIDVLNLGSPQGKRSPRIAGPSNPQKQPTPQTRPIRIYGSSSDSDSDSDSSEDQGSDTSKYCTSCVANGLTCSEGTEEASQGRCRQCEAMGTSCSWVEGKPIVQGLGEPKAGKYRRLHPLEIPASTRARKPKTKARAGEVLAAEGEVDVPQPKKRRRRTKAEMQMASAASTNGTGRPRKRGEGLKQAVGTPQQKGNSRRVDPLVLARAAKLAAQYDVFEPAASGTYEVDGVGRPVMRPISTGVSNKNPGTADRRMQEYRRSGIALKTKCTKCTELHPGLACVMIRDGKTCQGCWGIAWKCSLLEVGRARLRLEEEGSSRHEPDEAGTSKEAAAHGKPNGSGRTAERDLSDSDGRLLTQEESTSDDDSGDDGEEDEQEAGLLSVATTRNHLSDTSEGEDEGEVDDQVEVLALANGKGGTISTSPLLHNIVD